MSVDAVRTFVPELADEVEAGELAAKSVNNALGTLVVCLNSAVDHGMLAVNPALRVQRLPPAHIEREYLRLDEIPRYVDACSDVYRPLAELLIGSGLRISEALALRIGDLELEETGGVSGAVCSSTSVWRLAARRASGHGLPSRPATIWMRCVSRFRLCIVLERRDTRPGGLDAVRGSVIRTRRVQLSLGGFAHIAGFVGSRERIDDVLNGLAAEFPQRSGPHARDRIRECSHAIDLQQHGGMPST